jgi:predicted porin
MKILKNTACLIAMPLLALTGASVSAQSNVKISGMIDIGVYRGFDKVTNVGTIQRSNIAFTGTEDLGDGLLATFALSHRFDADTGANEGVGSKPFWQGESTVGLKGSLGHIRLGRALDVIYAYDWAFDPWGNFDRIASPAWNLWHYNYASDRTSNNGTAEYGRLANGVFYDSPSVAGFTAHLSGASEKSSAPGAGTGNNGGFSLNYDQGAIAAMLASSRNSNGDTVQFVAGKYSRGAWALMGAYDRSVYKAASDSTARVYTVGTTYNIGLTQLKLSLGQMDLDSRKTDFVGLGASQALSKRTNVYVSLGQRRPEASDSSTAYGVGVAHSF